LCAALITYSKASAASPWQRSLYSPQYAPRAMQDPGNLESDLQTGATTGYTLLWLLLCTTLMVGAEVILGAQQMCCTQGLQQYQFALNSSAFFVCAALTAASLRHITNIPFLVSRGS